MVLKANRQKSSSSSSAIAIDAAVADPPAKKSKKEPLNSARSSMPTREPSTSATSSMPTKEPSTYATSSMPPPNPRSETRTPTPNVDNVSEYSYDFNDMDDILLPAPSGARISAAAVGTESVTPATASRNTNPFLPTVLFDLVLEGGIIVPPKRNPNYSPDELTLLARMGEDSMNDQLWVSNIYEYYIVVSLLLLTSCITAPISWNKSSFLC
jgi:hypothetical protein